LEKLGSERDIVFAMLSNEVETTDLKKEGDGGRIGKFRMEVIGRSKSIEIVLRTFTKMTNNGFNFSEKVKGSGNRDIVSLEEFIVEFRGIKANDGVRGKIEKKKTEVFGGRSGLNGFAKIVIEDELVRDDSDTHVVKIVKAIAIFDTGLRERVFGKDSGLNFGIKNKGIVHRKKDIIRNSNSMALRRQR
jgi:hypothetical protein